MSLTSAFDFMLRSPDLTRDDMLSYCRNEDCVAHYDEIHPKRSLLSRWPFGPAIAGWRGYVGRRQLKLAIVRLDSLSAHLLADIGLETPQGYDQAFAPRQKAAWLEIAATYATPSTGTIAAIPVRVPAKLKLPISLPTPVAARAKIAFEGLAT